MPVLRVERRRQQLTRVLALEWSARGHNNAIAPTFIAHAGNGGTADTRSIWKACWRVTHRACGLITDVAARSSIWRRRAIMMVTGMVLPADGGWTAQGYQPDFRFHSRDNLEHSPMKLISCSPFASAGCYG
jgi:hypothetical protein